MNVCSRFGLRAGFTIRAKLRGGSHDQKHEAIIISIIRVIPLVQAKVNDQKLTEPTLSIAWTRVLLTRYSVHGTCAKTRCTILKIKGQHMLQKAIMPQSASLTQNMDIMHLKTQVSDTSHTVGPIENAPPRPTVRKLMEPTPRHRRCLAIERRWSSPSAITRAFQQYFKYHAAELRHT